MRGKIGRPGAGICPLRGHSNGQGDRTVGITEVPIDEFLDRFQATFGFAPPRERGHGAVEAIQAMLEERSKAFICLGDNLPVAMPDPHPVAHGIPDKRTATATGREERTIDTTRPAARGLIMRERAPATQAEARQAQSDGPSRP